MSDEKDKDKDIKKNCRSCFWWKHGSAKKICQRSAATFHCKDWTDKDKNRMCANCAWFNNFDECPKRSKDPHDVCMVWEAPQDAASPVVIPGKGEIRAMLAKGVSPLELTKAFQIEIKSMADLHVDDPHIKILKNHLGVLFSMMPVAEAKYKVDPSMNNCYAVTGMISASREILNDINNLEDPGQEYAQFVSEIIHPLTNAFLEIMTVSIGQMRTRLREYVKEDKISVLDTQINLTLKDIGSEMTNALNKQLEKLREIMGVEGETGEAIKPDVG